MRIHASSHSVDSCVALFSPGDFHPISRKVVKYAHLRLDLVALDVKALVLLIHTVKGVFKEADIYLFGTQKPPDLSCSTIHFWSNVTTLVGALESVTTPIFLTRATACLWFTTRRSSTRTPLGPRHRDHSSQAQGRRCFAHGCRLRVGRVSGHLTGRSPPVPLSALVRNGTAILQTAI